MIEMTVTQECFLNCQVSLSLVTGPVLLPMCVCVCVSWVSRGEPPADLVKVLQAIWTKQWHPFADNGGCGLPASVPPTVRALAAACCSAEPSERPSFVEVLEALGNSEVMEEAAMLAPAPSRENDAAEKETNTRALRGISEAPMANFRVTLSQMERPSSTENPLSRGSSAQASTGPENPSRRPGTSEHERQRSEHQLRVSEAYRASGSRGSGSLLMSVLQGGRKSRAGPKKKKAVHCQ